MSRTASKKNSSADLDVKALLQKIANAHNLGSLETTRTGDDFRECAAWCLEDALREAFEAGRASAVSR
jgi:hypothetical protein